MSEIDYPDISSPRLSLAPSMYATTEPDLSFVALFPNALVGVQESHGGLDQDERHQLTCAHRVRHPIRAGLNIATPKADSYFL
jgi:hypothetical protein